MIVHVRGASSVDPWPPRERLVAMSSAGDPVSERRRKAVAILGAGYVGMALAGVLVDRGYNVYVVRRRPRQALPGVRAVHGDLTRPDEITGLPGQVDHLVLSVAPSMPGGDDHEKTYLGSAEGTVAVARRHGACSILYTSSTAVYGGVDGSWVSEASPLWARSPRGRVLIGAEQRLWTFEGPVILLRVAGVYGPGRTAVERYARIEDLPARGEYWVNLVHRDDVVAAITCLLTLAPSRRVLNCSDGTPERAIDIARWLAAQRGTSIPSPIQFTRPDAQPRSNQRVDSRALRALGWRPRYPSFREGFLTLLGLDGR